MIKKIEEKTYYKPYLPQNGEKIKINDEILTVKNAYWCGIGTSDSNIYQITFIENSGYANFEVRNKTENSIKGFWGFFLNYQ